MARTQLDLAVKYLEFARQYSEELLADVQSDEWFRQPPQVTTHLAWQVGHLAMAQYGLTMLRVRGKRPEDRELMSNDFFRRFQKGSQPSADAQDYPPIAEILETFRRVYRQAMIELGALQDADLRDPTPAPYAIEPTKLGSIFFCSAHEMLHSGQIGLIRRLLGKAPLR
jgi:hypothetical protein